MKRGKAAGDDPLIGEFFMEGKQYVTKYLILLFNHIFKNGIFPEQWSLCIILPIHEAGDRRNPDNYRGITLMSILGKIYFSILNKRLAIWVEDYIKLSEEQAGFRKGYSTLDNIFVLNALIQKYLSKRKGRFYVAFIDFRKAFDSVDRKRLLILLEKIGLSGNILAH